MQSINSDREIFEKTMKLEKEKYEQWYHTIDLGNGEITDGIYNHQPYLKYYGFPKSLKGKRVLDAGSADGYFSFHFEKAGGKVMAIDAYKSNNLIRAKRKLHLNVDYRIIDIYDLSPEKVGYFDFAFCGTVLLHLSDPIKALAKIRSVLKPHSEFICANAIVHVPLEGFLRFLGIKLNIAGLASDRPSLGRTPGYWYPTEDCFKTMLYKAGFSNIKKVSNFTLVGYSKAIHSKQVIPHAVFKMEV